GSRQESLLARRRREIEHFLPGDADPCADDLREHLREPRPECEDEMIRRDLRTRFQKELGEVLPRGSWWLCGTGQIGAPGANQILYEELDRAPRHQRSEGGFVNAGSNAVEGEHRKSAGQLGLRKDLGREADLPMRRDRIAGVRLLRREEEQDSAWDEYRQPGGIAQRFPLLKRIQRHSSIDRVAAVSRSDQTRFTAGRGSAVGGAKCVDQRDLVTCLHELMRRPRTEHSGAYDCHMRSHHHDLSRNVAQAKGRSSRGGGLVVERPRSARNRWRTISACCSIP